MKKTPILPGVILLVVLCSMMPLPIAFVQAYTIVHVYSGDSLQHAIDVRANPGDTILVHPGMYIGPVDIDKTVTLRSEQGPRVTTIEGVWADTTITIRSNDVHSIGFTITHGG
jgi:nitrous oxidase accessory protein NosD